MTSFEIKQFSQDGFSHITQAIHTALEAGENVAVITGDWEVDRAIRLPSNFTLELDGCHLRMADGCYSNMFVNEQHDTEEGRTIEGTDRNISILGKNGAILDGGHYNGLSERNHRTNGLPPIWKNNLILFTNVDGFEISGISCHNQRWWALNFIYCRNGKLHDIDFRACDILIEKDGTQTHGLRREKGAEILVKNADGIDIRQGCHDIVIRNITGFTEDDSIALTGLDGKLEQTFAVEGLPKDICNIQINNIATASFCTNVRMLNQCDVKLHDILVDGVYDVSEATPYMDRGIYAVRVGDTRLYGERHATADETYNIVIRNVKSRGAIAAVGLAGNMKNVEIEQVECLEDTPLLEDKRKGAC